MDRGSGGSAQQEPFGINGTVVPDLFVDRLAVAAELARDRAAVTIEQSRHRGVRRGGVCFRSVANVYLSSEVIW